MHNCRMCGGKTVTVLNFGSTALANQYVPFPVEQNEYPLKVMQCSKCELVQLEDTVNPHLLFDEYLYVSSTSPVFVKHFEDYAREIHDRFKLSPDDLVIDIGSNDGILLKKFSELGVRVLGIDPAENIAKNANDKGIPTINAFLDMNLAKSMPKARIITANNVFAHTDKIEEFLESVKLMLAEGGFFVFEVQYLGDLLEKGLFDMIYHEHIFYYHLKPLIEFFEKHGLPIFDVEHVDVHGGSIRVFAGLPGKSERLRQMIESENFTGKCFTILMDKVLHYRRDLLKRLSKFKGKAVCGYGAPAKATTFLKTFGIKLDYIVDDSHLKQGLLMPGSHIPIYPTNKLYESDACVVLAWNFADSIIKKHKKYKGTFLLPF